MRLRTGHIRSRRGDDESGDTKAMPIGLAQNPPGRAFQCGTCEWFDGGRCQNKNPRLNGRHVEREWCCNLYDNDDMKIVVR
jgi:hypothetical protein